MLRATCPEPRTGSGKLWDDLGSTQFVTSKSGAGETRPRTNAKRKLIRGRSIGSSDDDDEDELDFLSSGSRSEDVEETSPCKGKRRAMKGQPKKAVVQGQELNYLPGYPPKRKYPNFKKLPKEGGVSTSRNKLPDVSQEVPKQISSDGILPTLSRLSGTSSDEGAFVGDTHSLNRVRPRREIQLSDSSDCSQATPRAKHSKGRRPEKFPTLDPLSISDSTTHVQASHKAVAKRKVRLRGPSDRVTSLVHKSLQLNRRTLVMEAATIAGDLEEFGDDSLFIGEPADPSMLCPFCDERLPPNPSPLYRSLLEAAKRKAYPDARPSNPRGLKASMGIYIALCKRHRFEAHQIPEAIAKGWPMDIDFGKVRDRVEQLRDSLGKLVNGEGNARDENIYWTTVIKEVQKMGSRAASSVKGQFESFQRTQPGYYGELGSMIMHQTLYNMFPPTSFDARSIAPLTPQDFIQRILVPEAALALIMEDTGQDRTQAVRTMRESAGYGVAMFPDTSEGPGVGAGEDIVLERARARRRQLDDEERMEAMFHSVDSEDEKSSKNKGTKRPKKLNSTTTTDIEGSSATQHKMKRKKAGSRTDAESEADDHRCGVMEDIMGASSNFAAGYSALRSPPQAVPSSPSPGPSTLEFNLAQLTRVTNMDSKPRSTQSDTYSDSKRVSINTGVAPVVSPNSLGRPDGRSMSAPIDVDAQVIYVADTTSQSEGEPQHIPVGAPHHGLRSSRTTVGVSGSSDAEVQEMENDRPTTRPKPRRQLPERAASAGRRLEPNNPLSLLSARDPGRDSSIEIIEPPPNSHRFPWDEATTSDNTGGDFTNTRRPPVGQSRPNHETHDWLINDSD
ncbi:RTC4-like domain-containing protein [Lactarius akahatsu]|uniref:Restriction of telomere capping protein 4 n=1 Tax=Lactarius akahatsu TaxID=416441 RepID=A0AAD4QF41_9AGAM|nr:RTC4-like domain-containing protein [Lactarius akahatsu]